MRKREDPAEEAQSRSLAPAVLSAPALDGTHSLHKSTDHREQQIQPSQPEQQTLHETAADS